MDNQGQDEGGRPNGGGAADTAEHAADAVRQAAQNLRGQEAWIANLIEQGADKLSDLAQTMRTTDLRTLLTRVEEFARSQPVLFAGAAMALGFAMTRAVGAATRSSNESEPEHQSFGSAERGRYDH